MGFQMQHKLKTWLDSFGSTSLLIKTAKYFVEDHLSDKQTKTIISFFNSCTSPAVAVNAQQWPFLGSHAKMVKRFNTFDK